MNLQSNFGIFKSEPMHDFVITCRICHTKYFINSFTIIILDIGLRSTTSQQKAAHQHIIQHISTS